MNKENEGKIENEIASKKRKNMNEEQNWEKIKKRPNSKQLRRGLPAELINEIFAALSMEKSYGILVGMPNSLLARNVRKMLKSIKMTMKANKWNAADCGTNLTIISEEGLIVKRFGLDGWNSVRAELPIPKLNLMNTKLISYFEVEFLKRNDQYEYNFGTGFCTKHFPLEGRIDQENEENSIGICSKRGILIGGSYSEFEKAANPYFNTGDVVGIGIVHFPSNSPLKWFATCNGKLLGMAELPAKFADLELFPMVQLLCGNSIRANFGQNEWRFNPEQLHQ